MNNEPGQIGVNPVPYDFSKWDEYDPFGKLITNERIEHVKHLIMGVYSSVPSFESHGKEAVDNWIQTQLNNAESSEETIAALNTTLMTHFIAVIRIRSGFFVDHSIVLRDIQIDPQSGRSRVDFSVTDATGKPLEKPEALEYVVNSVVKLLMLEQALEDEINAEKETRIAG